MTPGLTTRPVTSIERRAESVRRPTSTISPSWTATSATRRGRPDPSTTVPPRRIRSTMECLLPRALRRDGFRGEKARRAMDASEQILVHAVADFSGCELETTQSLVQDRVPAARLGIAQIVDHPFDLERALVHAMAPLAVVDITRTGRQVERA